MTEEFKCPVCESRNWQDGERFIYAKQSNSAAKPKKYLPRSLRAMLVAGPRKIVGPSEPLTKYQKLRREVLFDVWFPGKTEVGLVSQLCQICGFVCYAPRPTDRDIAEKYTYLKHSEPDQGGQSGHSKVAIKLDAGRATRTYEACMPHATKKTLHVLDYGGGNGKLMVPFLENGHNCFLIDYNENPIEGIVKLSDDIQGYKGDQKFDVIVCSHVLEHVSDIQNLVGALRGLLAPEGVLFAEVPVDIWAGLWIERDPVTHINYFTKHSIQNLFLHNGYGILEAKQEVSNYGSGFKEIIWLTAKKQVSESRSLLESDLNRFLYPSRWYSFKKFINLSLGSRVKKILAAI